MLYYLGTFNSTVGNLLVKLPYRLMLIQAKVRILKTLGWNLCFIFFANALFDLFLHVRFGIIEFAYTATYASHEFRDLPSPEKYQNGNNDDDPFSSTWHA